MGQFTVEEIHGVRARLCGDILGPRREWFGIPEATDAGVEGQPMLACTLRADGAVAGLLLLRFYTTVAAEAPNAHYEQT